MYARGFFSLTILMISFGIGPAAAERNFLKDTSLHAAGAAIHRLGQL
jgi:hypothetical protein